MSEADRKKWDARYLESNGALGEACGFLKSWDAYLPKVGRALDVGGGSGRNALWLARRGLDVTLLDISEVGLSQARAAFKSQGLRMRTLMADLDHDSLPTGPWDLILCTNFLCRKLFSAADSLLAPGGLLVVSQPTRTNLKKHPKPGEQYLLGDGELPLLVDPLLIELYEEGWLDEGRHEGRIRARKAW